MHVLHTVNGNVHSTHLQPITADSLSRDLLSFLDIIPLVVKICHYVTANSFVCCLSVALVVANIASGS